MSTLDDPGPQRIARFWDARGREDALRYSVPGGASIEEDAFAASGPAVLAAATELVGWRLSRRAAVADVGCGAGRVTAALAERAASVVACDVSSVMLDVARGRLAGAPGVDWHHAHAGDLATIETSSLDAVVLLGVLPHMPDEQGVADALAEAGRVLEQDGTVLFDLRCAPAPLVLPGEEPVPAHVSRHPLWRGAIVDLESLAAIAHQEWLEIERIAGSETGRSLVLARRA